VLEGHGIEYSVELIHVRKVVHDCVVLEGDGKGVDNNRQDNRDVNDQVPTSDILSTLIKRSLVFFKEVACVRSELPQIVQQCDEGLLKKTRAILERGHVACIRVH
jgi:hypothetical protein